MFYSLDIETENEGIGVLNGVKRVLSIQIGTDTNQELYYADSEEKGLSLQHGIKRIEQLVDDGYSFSGYNIKGFDLKILKDHYDLAIPQSKVIDLMESDAIKSLKQRTNRTYASLEWVCQAYSIDSSHKKQMDEYSRRYYDDTRFKTDAIILGKMLVSQRGWDPDYCERYALKNLSFKQAIIDTFLEFIKANGSHDSLFYRYAIGDIICEHKLLKALAIGK